MAWTKIGTTSPGNTYSGNTYAFDVYYEETTDAANNKSKVRVKIDFVRTAGSSYLGRSYKNTNTITINGTSKSVPKPTRVQSGSSGYWRANGVDYDGSTAWDKSYYTDQVEVTHGSDGKKSITISASLYIADTNTTGSWTVNLTNFGVIYAFPKDTSLAYNASARNPYIVITKDSAGNTALSGATVSYGTSTSYGKSGTTNSSGQLYLTGTQLTNVGSTTIYYKVTMSGYVTKTGSFTFTITKANNSWTTTGTGINKVYTGSAQTIVATAPVAKWGTVQYSTDNSTWSTTKPTKTDVASGTVYFKVPGTTNYNDLTGNATWKITQATNSWTTNPAYASANYTGSNITLITNTPAAKFGTVQYSTDNSTWSNSKPAKSAVGNYTVYVRVAATTNYTGLSTNGTAKILSTSVVVKIWIPDTANLRAASAGTFEGASSTYYEKAVPFDRITGSGWSYNSSTYEWSKTFSPSTTIDYPNIEEFVNNTKIMIPAFADDSAQTYSGSFSNARNSAWGPVGWLFLGYSTTKGAVPTYKPGDGQKTGTGGTLTLYPSLEWINGGSMSRITYTGTNYLSAKCTLVATNATYCQVGHAVAVRVDWAAKDSATAPTSASTIIYSNEYYADNTKSQWYGTFNITKHVNSGNGQKNAGVWRYMISYSCNVTTNGVQKTMMKYGHLKYNYLQIDKANRDITMNKTTLTMLTNATDTSFKVTGWKNADTSASKINILSASSRASVTPAQVSANGTVTIKTGWYPGTVKINCTIPETDNYKGETKQLTLTINGRGNGVYWYDGTQWVLTEPFVYNGASWSNDFI